MFQNRIQRFPNNELVVRISIVGKCFRNLLLTSRFYKKKYLDSRHLHILEPENLLSTLVASREYFRPNRENSIVSEK